MQHHSLSSPPIMVALLMFTAFLAIGCGRFEANLHPDQFLENSRDLSLPSNLNSYMQLRSKNPLFRKAKVTTVSGNLKVKNQPSSFAGSPAKVANSLAKNQIIDVYWPTEINNNHIKILISNQTAWVTYKSNQGHQYVTLLEDLELPSITIPGFQATTSFSGASATSGNFSDVDEVNLPSSAINGAHEAIGSVALRSADISSCHFNPMVGNSQANDNCYRHIVLSENFKNFIATHGNQCALRASREAFGKRAEKILFHSSYAGQVKIDRYVSGSSKKSTHSTGQALDLFAISAFFPGGESRRVTLHKNETDGSSVTEKENHKFYWSYVNCWRSRVRNHSPCNCSDSKAGAMTYLENSAHHNHVHMSIPHCERTQYNVSCV